MRLSLILFLAAVASLAGCGRGPSSAGGNADWANHMGNVPFTVGDYDSGLALAKETGKPPLYFVTAHW